MDWTTVSRNDAITKTKGIYVSECKTSIRDSRFIGDGSNGKEKGLKGSFIYAFDSELGIEESYFSGGFANEGGVAYFESSSQPLEAERSEFRGNVAENGGVFKITGLARLDGNKYVDNIATASGSVIAGTDLYPESRMAEETIEGIKGYAYVFEKADSIVIEASWFRGTKDQEF